MKKIKLIAPILVGSSAILGTLPMVSCGSKPSEDTTADVEVANLSKTTKADVVFTTSPSEATIGLDFDVKINFAGQGEKEGTNYYSWLTVVMIGTNVYYQATNVNPKGFTFLEPDSTNQVHILIPGNFIVSADEKITIMLDIEETTSTFYAADQEETLETSEGTTYHCLGTTNFSVVQDQWITFGFSIAKWKEVYGSDLQGDLHMFLFDLNQGSETEGQVLIPIVDRFGEICCGQHYLEAVENTETGKVTISSPVGGWPENGYIIGSYKFRDVRDGCSFLLGQQTI